MTLIIAYIRCFIHCLVRFHRAETYTIGRRTVWMGCGCGKSFYTHKSLRS